MLQFAEEITLLALNDETGKLHSALPERAFDFAVAGAVLLELAFLNRVDTDAENLILLDGAPLADTVLDEALTLVSVAGKTVPTVRAVARLTLKAPDWEPELFRRLVRKGILREKDSSFLWIKGERTYPMIDGREETEVRTRIRKIILTDTLPDPRDVAIIALMEACKLHRTVFVPDELSHVRSKIRAVAKMDFIGQAMLRGIEQVQDVPLEQIAYA